MKNLFIGGASEIALELSKYLKILTLSPLKLSKIHIGKILKLRTII